MNGSVNDIENNFAPYHLEEIFSFSSVIESGMSAIFQWWNLRNLQCHKTHPITDCLIIRTPNPRLLLAGNHTSSV